MTETDLAPSSSPDALPHLAFYQSPETLRAGLDEVRRSPRDEGVLELIVVRPALGERQVLDEVVVDSELGLDGDTWSSRGSRRTPDGGPNPEAQVTVMNSRAAQLVATSRDRWALAGDQLYVDLDISRENLPTGTRLVFDEVELEVTAAPHTGCSQFRDRFGVDALKLTATPDGRELRLRGINTKVAKSGRLRAGERVVVRRPL